MAFVAGWLVAGGVAAQVFVVNLVRFARLAEQSQCRCRNVLGGESQGFQHFGAGAGCAEAVDTDVGAVLAGVTGPTDGRSRFDRDAGGADWSQHGSAIVGIVRVEQLPARHADDAGRNAVALHCLVDVDAQLHLSLIHI